VPRRSAFTNHRRPQRAQWGADSKVKFVSKDYLIEINAIGVLSAGGDER
jgi:hypothetical protein